MAPRRHYPDTLTAPNRWPGTLLLAAFLTLVAVAGAAQEAVNIDGGPAQSSSAVVGEPGIYRLPRSHSQSIYFLPRSAELVESASASLAAIAAELKATPVLRITVVGYADDFGEAACGDRLRSDRATAVADTLLEMGVPSWRVSIGSPSEDGEAAVRCISEYCRQNYRRAALLLSKQGSHQRPPAPP